MMRACVYIGVVFVILLGGCLAHSPKVKKAVPQLSGDLRPTAIKDISQLIFIRSLEVALSSQSLGSESLFRLRGEINKFVAHSDKRPGGASEEIKTRVMILSTEIDLRLLSQRPGSESEISSSLEMTTKTLSRKPRTLDRKKAEPETKIKIAKSKVTQAIKPVETDKKTKKSPKESVEPEQKSITFHWPLKKVVVTSSFGMRNDPKKPKKRKMHKGVDLDGDTGDPVTPTAPGKVIVAGWRNKLCGYSVFVEHKGNFVSIYLHLSKVEVSVGDEVGLKTVIGRVGSTGKSTGSHLHFQINFNDKAVDPIPFMGRTVEF